MTKQTNTEINESMFSFDLDGPAPQVETEEVVKEVVEVEQPVVEEVDVKDITEDPVLGDTTEEVEEITEEVTEKTTTEETKRTEEVIEETTEEVDDFGDKGALIQSLVDDETLSFNEDKEYEASSDGIKELINDNVETKAEAKLNAYKESLGVEAQEYLKFVEEGGTFDDFKEIKSEVDYNRVPLERDGDAIEGNQVQIVKDYMEKVKGLSPEDIKEFIDVFKEKGAIGEKAKAAKQGLVDWQTEKKESLLKSRKEAEATQLKEEAKLQEEFQEKVLGTREVAGFKISKNEASKLHEFITVQDSDGKTGFAKADTEDKRLLYAYFAMKGFDKESLAKEERKKAAINLKKKLSNYTDTQVKPTRGSARPTRQENKPIEIEWLM